MTERCHKCDRDECDLPAAEAEVLRLQRLPGKRLVREQREAAATLRAAQDRRWGAVVACAPHAVDWRTRCLAAEAQTPDLIAARLHAMGKAEMMHARWLAASERVEAGFREGYVKGHADGVKNVSHTPTLAWETSRSKADMGDDL